LIGGSVKKLCTGRCKWICIWIYAIGMCANETFQSTYRMDWWQWWW